jgi:hypothetical protein
VVKGGSIHPSPSSMEIEAKWLGKSNKQKEVSFPTHVEIVAWKMTRDGWGSLTSGRRFPSLLM